MMVSLAFGEVSPDASAGYELFAGDIDTMSLPARISSVRLPRAHRRIWSVSAWVKNSKFSGTANAFLAMMTHLCNSIEAR
jgi:hypothetical protein